MDFQIRGGSALLTSMFFKGQLYSLIYESCTWVIVLMFIIKHTTKIWCFKTHNKDVNNISIRCITEYIIGQYIVRVRFDISNSDINLYFKWSSLDFNFWNWIQPLIGWLCYHYFYLMCVSQKTCFYLEVELLGPPSAHSLLDVCILSAPLNP